MQIRLLLIILGLTMMVVFAGSTLVEQSVSATTDNRSSISDIRSTHFSMLERAHLEQKVKF